MKSKLFKEYTSNVDTNMTSVVTSVKNKIASSIDTYKFNLKWHDRNKQYGEIIVKTKEPEAFPQLLKPCAKRLKVTEPNSKSFSPGVYTGLRTPV